MSLPRAVVALGGNALLRRGEPLEAASQAHAARDAARLLGEASLSHQLVITHGNGPQVGLLALMSDAYTGTKPYPLDVLGSETVGQIGYVLEMQLDNYIDHQDTVAVITRVVVDDSDPAFASPSKFIGPVYTEAEARAAAEQHGWTVKPDGDRWRRVVASPKPHRIVQLGAIRSLVDAGFLVVCAGGGGVPVLQDGDGRHRGVEAVIDKDLASSLLATELGVGTLVLATDVDAVYDRYGTDEQRPIVRATPAALREHDFPAGSMGPKVEAVCRFVERTGGRAVIGSLDQVRELLDGRAGTQVVAEGPGTRSSTRSVARAVSEPRDRERRAPAPEEPGASLAERVRRLMPDLISDLVRLARIPSIAFPGFPNPPLLEAHDVVAGLLRDAGVQRVATLSLPGTAPVITGDIPGPDGAPTVLLYAHYDVQPPGDGKLWRTPPFEPTERDGAIYGRGVADDKSNVLVHVGALRAHGGKPPVGVKVVIEGQEEYGSALDTYPPQQPELFRADAIVVGDAGNLRPGVPTLTVALRGDAEVIVGVRTLAAAKHSGEFGGPAPDALVVLLHALATLHDARGDVAVAGLRREPWDGASYADEEFRELAEIEPGLPLFGTGSIGERLWSGPALTVVGIDAPSVEQAVNAVIPHARAKLNLRVHPEQDAAQAQAALIRHLESLRPFGVPLTVEAGDAGDGFTAATSGPAYEAARAALRTAWGSDPVTMASGGSIPLLNALHEAVPDAEILLFGAEDGQCNLHAPNERVLLDELERAVVAEAEFFRQYSTRRESDDD